MEEELLKIKQNLKKKQTKEAKIVTTGEISKENEESVRQQFFESGAQNWMELLQDHTFQTKFLDLDKQEAQEILKLQVNILKKQREDIQIEDLKQIIQSSQILNNLSEKINQAQNGQEKWEKVFVKLSTRSPKDSYLIVNQAQKEYNELNKEELSDSDKVREFSNLIQSNFCVENGEKALMYFLTSKRIQEDLDYAVQGDYKSYNLQIVIRKWDQMIPIDCEFRGFLTNNQLNAVGQYYHPLVFPRLFEIKDQISQDILKYFQEKIQKLIPKELSTCIIDFAYLGSNNIKVIELNPFDGQYLGCFPGSTGLFRWEDEIDKKIIQQGPYELRLNSKERTIQEVKMTLNTEWRDIIFPHQYK